MLGDQIGLRGFRVTNPQRMEERRRAILLAAARVFEEKGYAAATMDDIAERLGASKGVIYYQFRNKEEIIAELRIILAQEETADLEAFIALGHPPDVTLRYAIATLARRQFRELNRHSVLLRNPPDLSAENLQRIKEAESRYVRLLQELLQCGMDSNVFIRRPIPVATHCIIEGAFSHVLWYKPDGVLTPDDVVEALTDQLMAGLLTRPPAPPAPADHRGRPGPRDTTAFE